MNFTLKYYLKSVRITFLFFICFNIVNNTFSVILYLSSKLSNTVLPTRILSKNRKVIITSDHGYIRTESSYNFRVSDDVKRKIKDSFGNKRAISMEDADAGILVKHGFAIDFDGFYILKSRYISTGTGQYITYLHGGISLMECYVPKITLEK